MLPVSEGRRVSESSKSPGDGKVERWLGEIWDGGSGGGVGGKGPCLLCLPSALLHRPAVGRGRQRPALEIQDSTIALFWSAQPLTNQDCWEQTLLFFLFRLFPSSSSSAVY